MKNKKIVLWIVILISVFLCVGWIKNIISFVRLDFQPPYKAEVIRGIGISSYGAIIGWIKIKD